MIFEPEAEDALDDAGLDLTPLIDVVFLLLVFFIMATTFSKPVVDVLLPRAESGDMADGKSADMVVAIDAEGRVFYDGEEVPRSAFPELMSRQPDRTLNFFVDHRAPFESFVAALDQARLKRRSELVITTEPLVGPGR
ncbi:MAG: ExbD/TolR family protein [Desulfococcaceae bacterium]